MTTQVVGEIDEKATALVLGAVWVEPNSSAAGGRMMQLLTYFVSAGYDVVFGSAATKSQRSVSLSDFGVREVQVELNNDSFDRLLQELHPDVVIYDRFMLEEQFGWRVSEFCPQALQILDTEDLHSLRKVRQEAIKKGGRFSLEKLLESDMTKREVAAILRCDLSLIISSYEMQLLTRDLKVDPAILLHLPFMLHEISEREERAWLPYESREHIVFIGNYLHAPNVDAVLQLKNKVWGPLRNRLPSVQLHIYGAYMTQQIKQLHNEKEGFLVKGVVEDAQKVVSQARLVLAPLRFGAGIKGKLTEAMLCGTPSVTTSIGAEGMHADLAWSGMIEDDLESFVHHAVELYERKKEWAKCQKQGIRIINTLYNQKTLACVLSKKIDTLRSQLSSHRQSNVVGQILKHQSLYASKYMGMWITEKNRECAKSL